MTRITSKQLRELLDRVNNIYESNYRLSGYWADKRYYTLIGSSTDCRAPWGLGMTAKELYMYLQGLLFGARVVGDKLELDAEDLRRLGL